MCDSTCKALRYFALGVVLATGCDLPRDPEGTLERVRGGVLRVGVMHEPPWTRVGHDGRSFTGIEVGLARELAARFNAKIQWRRGGESRLMEALSNFDLDLVIGGLRESSAWKPHVALTRPYFEINAADGATAAHVLAAPPGENGWLLAIDRFLQQERPQIARRVLAAKNRVRIQQPTASSK
jgi:hypothetical protein